MVSFDEQRSVLRVAGDEDVATQSRRRPALSRALITAADDVVVDLSDLSFADPSLMLDLAMVARRRRRTGGRLVLRGAQPDIRRLIELVGIDRQPGVVAV